MRVKIAVVPPIQSANVSTAAAVNTGDIRNWRTE
jgi:tRNA G18 (ribose-2'-O)-methylase SpoU